MACPVGGIICPVGPMFQGENPVPPCGVWNCACGTCVAPPPGVGTVAPVPVCVHAGAPGSMPGAFACRARLAAYSCSSLERLVLSAIVYLKSVLVVCSCIASSGPACLSFPFLCDSVVPLKLPLHVSPRRNVRPVCACLRAHLFCSPRICVPFWESSDRRQSPDSPLGCAP